MESGRDGFSNIDENNALPFPGDASDFPAAPFFFPFSRPGKKSGKYVRFLVCFVLRCDIYESFLRGESRTNWRNTGGDLYIFGMAKKGSGG